MGWRLKWQVLTSHSHGGWKSKIRKLASLGPAESPLSDRCLLLYPHVEDRGERGRGERDTEREREKKCVGNILDKKYAKMTTMAASGWSDIE